MTELSVFETSNADEIRCILSDTDICDRISSDIGGSIDVDNLPISDKYTYIGGYVEGNIIALTIYAHKIDYSIMHFYVLPDYRLGFAREFAEKSLKLKRPLPLFAITPECYMPVVNFAIKMGFKVYGMHEELFIKNGVKYKQIITRL